MIRNLLQPPFRCCLTGLVFSFLLFTTCKPKSTAYEPVYSADSVQTKNLILGLPTQSYYEIWTAFVTYLNDHLPGIHIQAVASPSFLAYVDSWNASSYDILLVNGIMVLDSVGHGYSSLGTSVEETGNAGVILVNKDSSINSFADLKGKLVASVGDPGLAGRMLPMMYLFKNGVNVNRDIKLKHLDSFESVILNIYLGKCSAGFTSLNIWTSFLKKRPELAKKVSKKWETPAVEGNSLLIRNNVSEETISQLKRVILDMHLNEKGKKALAHIGYVKFNPTDSNTYRSLRSLVKEYKELIVDPQK